jgi:pyruvate/2-oxoglutarate dehydrogenase complex dihydrolipoamide dehydrogenase (E3) component
MAGSSLSTASRSSFLLPHELAVTLIFAGGGFISFEFADVAAQAGCKVMIGNIYPSRMTSVGGSP